jgi:hypothetical protein
MTSEHLTAVLAETVMGWSVGPDRFMMGRRSWQPRWRFQPLTRIGDAFQLLDMVVGTFRLSTGADGVFTAQVYVGNRVGSASGEPKATSITLAVARAIGIDIPDQAVPGFIRSQDHSVALSGRKREER